MLSDRKPLSAGFSEDGYIIDQDCFHEYRYRTMRADINSCGWIAAYNIRHFLGQDAEWDDVRREMEEMHVLNIPGPTHMRVMRQYLNKYISGVMISYGKEQALEAAKNSLLLRADGFCSMVSSSAWAGAYLEASTSGCTKAKSALKEFVPWEELGFRCG